MPKFYVPVDLGHTALLLSDVQDQIIKRFPPEVANEYLSRVQLLLQTFRGKITRRRNLEKESPQTKPNSIYDEVPLIVHHVLPFGINSNGFVSSYNKLASWVKNLESKGFFTTAPPHQRTPTTRTTPSPPFFLLLKAGAAKMRSSYQNSNQGVSHLQISWLIPERGELGM